MNAPKPDLIGPSLAAVFPAYREAMDRYDGDILAAERVFNLAQALGLGFWAGIEHAKRGAPE